MLMVDDPIVDLNARRVRVARDEVVGALDDLYEALDLLRDVLENRLPELRKRRDPEV